jgi:hypothetical protein
VTHQRARRLSGEEIAALRFAAHRQLARWSTKPRLSPDQHARRSALKRAARVLQHNAFTNGCELSAPDAGQDAAKRGA